MPLYTLYNADICQGFSRSERERERKKKREWRVIIVINVGKEKPHCHYGNCCVLSSFIWKHISNKKWYKKPTNNNKKKKAAEKWQQHFINNDGIHVKTIAGNTRLNRVSSYKKISKNDLWSKSRFVECLRICKLNTFGISIFSLATFLPFRNV